MAVMPDIAYMASGEAANVDVILSMMWIAIAALASPLLSFLTGKRVPGVVFMLVLGVIIGPEVLGLASSDGSNALLRELGLGMLFLLAGWEIDPDSIHGKQGRRAAVTWIVSLLAAFGAALIVFGNRDVLTSVVMAIAVSSTAMGTLLPVIKTAGVADSPVGRGVLVHGAVGELGPVFAMALLLSTRATWLTLVILVLFMGGAIVVALVPRSVSLLVPWVGRAVRDGASHTSQTIMRAVIVLLTLLMAMAAVFELDVVLGAFAAGIILRALVPVRARKTVEARLDVLGYGLLIPVFFISSGMAIDVSSVLSSLWIVVLAVVVILGARGVPIFLAERFTDTGSGIVGLRDQLQLSLYSATGLPIIVAVTEIALQRDLIAERLASVLVSAGAVTVLLFPLMAVWVANFVPGPQSDDADADADADGDDAASGTDAAQVSGDADDAPVEAHRQAGVDNEETAAPKRRTSSTVDDEEITLDDDHPSSLKNSAD